MTLINELSEDDAIERALKGTDEYDMHYFEKALESMAKEVKMYEVLGSDFKSDLKLAKQMYSSLELINEWYKLYNTTELDKRYAKRVTRLCQLKVYMEKYELNAVKFNDYTFCSGLYTPIELYVIPFSLVNVEEVPIDKGPVLKLLKKICVSVEAEGNPYNLPEDAYYGSARVISNTHFAVVVKGQNNPFGDRATRALNWRYIHSSGYAL